jgi:hypothetical protein
VADDSGIDCVMCGAYGSMQAYVCIPPLVIHDDEQPSDRVGADCVGADRVADIS